MTARSIAEGRVVMAELASIDVQLADIAVERIDLLERERMLLAKRAALFSGEAGAEQSVDLRTNARRRRQIDPKPIVTATETGRQLAQQALERNETRRRSGT